MVDRAHKNSVLSYRISNIENIFFKICPYNLVSFNQKVHLDRFNSNLFKNSFT